MAAKNLNLKYTNPIVAVDGQSIIINDAGPINIVFFQARQETPEGLEADVVAGVRFHSLQELKNFDELIQDTIRKHENKEP